MVFLKSVIGKEITYYGLCLCITQEIKVVLEVWEGLLQRQSGINGLQEAVCERKLVQAGLGTRFACTFLLWWVGQTYSLFDSF